MAGPTGPKGGKPRFSAATTGQRRGSGTAQRFQGRGTGVSARPTGSGSTDARGSTDRRLPEPDFAEIVARSAALDRMVATSGAPRPAPFFGPGLVAMAQAVEHPPAVPRVTLTPPPRASLLCQPALGTHTAALVDGLAERVHGEVMAGTIPVERLESPDAELLERIAAHAGALLPVGPEANATVQAAHASTMGIIVNAYVRIAHVYEATIMTAYETAARLGEQLETLEHRTRQYIATHAATAARRAIEAQRDALRRAWEEQVGLYTQAVEAALAPHQAAAAALAAWASVAHHGHTELATQRATIEAQLATVGEFMALSTTQDQAAFDAVRSFIASALTAAEQAAPPALPALSLPTAPAFESPIEVVSTTDEAEPAGLYRPTAQLDTALTGAIRPAGAMTAVEPVVAESEATGAGPAARTDAAAKAAPSTELAPLSFDEVTLNGMTLAAARTQLEAIDPRRARALDDVCRRTIKSPAMLRNALSQLDAVATSDPLLVFAAISQIDVKLPYTVDALVKTLHGLVQEGRAKQQDYVRRLQATLPADHEWQRAPDAIANAVRAAIVGHMRRRITGEDIALDLRRITAEVTLVEIPARWREIAGEVFREEREAYREWERNVHFLLAAAGEAMVTQDYLSVVTSAADPHPTYAGREVFLVAGLRAITRDWSQVRHGTLEELRRCLTGSATNKLMTILPKFLRYAEEHGIYIRQRATELFARAVARAAAPMVKARRVDDDTARACVDAYRAAQAAADLAARWQPVLTGLDANDLPALHSALARLDARFATRPAGLAHEVGRILGVYDDAAFIRTIVIAHRDAGAAPDLLFTRWLETAERQRAARAEQVVAILAYYDRYLPAPHPSFHEQIRAALASQSPGSESDIDTWLVTHCPPFGQLGLDTIQAMVREAQGATRVRFGLTPAARKKTMEIIAGVPMTAEHFDAAMAELAGLPAPTGQNTGTYFTEVHRILAVHRDHSDRPPQTRAERYLEADRFFRTFLGHGYLRGRDRLTELPRMLVEYRVVQVYDHYAGKQCPPDWTMPEALDRLLKETPKLLDPQPLARVRLGLEAEPELSTRFAEAIHNLPPIVWRGVARHGLITTARRPTRPTEDGGETTADAVDGVAALHTIQAHRAQYTLLLEQADLVFTAAGLAGDLLTLVRDRYRRLVEDAHLERLARGGPAPRTDTELFAFWAGKRGLQSSAEDLVAWAKRQQAVRPVVTAAAEAAPLPAPKAAATPAPAPPTEVRGVEVLTEAAPYEFTGKTLADSLAMILGAESAVVRAARTALEAHLQQLWDTLGAGTMTHDSWGEIPPAERGQARDRVMGFLYTSKNLLTRHELSASDKALFVVALQTAISDLPRFITLTGLLQDLRRKVDERPVLRVDQFAEILRLEATLRARHGDRVAAADLYPALRMLILHRKTNGLGARTELAFIEYTAAAGQSIATVPTQLGRRSCDFIVDGSEAVELKYCHWTNDWSALSEKIEERARDAIAQLQRTRRAGAAAGVTSNRAILVFPEGLARDISTALDPERPLLAPEERHLEALRESLDQARRAADAAGVQLAVASLRVDASFGSLHQMRDVPKMDLVSNATLRQLADRLQQKTGLALDVLTSDRQADFEAWYMGRAEPLATHRPRVTSYPVLAEYLEGLEFALMDVALPIHMPALESTVDRLVQWHHRVHHFADVADAVIDWEDARRRANALALDDTLATDLSTNAAALATQLPRLDADEVDTIIETYADATAALHTQIAEQIAAHEAAARPLLDEIGGDEDAVYLQLIDETELVAGLMGIEATALPADAPALHHVVAWIWDETSLGDLSATGLALILRGIRAVRARIEAEWAAGDEETTPPKRATRPTPNRQALRRANQEMSNRLGVPDVDHFSRGDDPDLTVPVVNRFIGGLLATIDHTVHADMCRRLETLNQRRALLTRLRMQELRDILADYFARVGTE